MEFKHFSFYELIHSKSADELQIKNFPETLDTFRHLAALIQNVLDPLRDAIGCPITVNSGFRSPLLNNLVGGVPGSQHLLGQAADITTGDHILNRKMVTILTETHFDFDQLIVYPGYRFIHVSYVSQSQNRNEIIWKLNK